MYSLMRALNIEESVGGLRYDKVIMATDADVDGLHIRNLMLTYFLHYFESLVKRGHVYILETPIFRVRNKQETVYCYSEKEKISAEKKAERPGRKRLGGDHPLQGPGRDLAQGVQAVHRPGHAACSR
jgi:topoisomerase IV subunit B